MIKQLLLSGVVSLLCIKAHAQFRYTFKDTTISYTPLSGATSLNGSIIWDDENLTAPMPFSWKMDSSFSLNKLNMVFGVLGGFVSDTTNLLDMNGFYFGDVDLIDRGYFDIPASTLSPISYVTSGASPNRIFKLQIANAGFYEEWKYHTMSDFVNVQIWVYETTNVVEMHFGASQITYPTDYYLLGGNGPNAGYAKHVDYFSGSAGKMYYLKGTASSPTLDTATLPVPPTGSLSSWPASGQVYRFTPKWKNCTVPSSSFTSGSPAGTTVQYTYSGSTPVDSVRWDFGDGSGSSAMNPSHTFPSIGHYNVCVTAYNNCGTNTYCKQLALAVAGMDALGKVLVYPNPAAGSLTIECMHAGDRAVLQSITGQEVANSSINSARQTMDISSLPAGTYILQLSNNDGERGLTRITKQ